MTHEALTEKIIAGAFKVHNVLGSGFLEKVYENALLYELQRMGLRVRQQEPVKVYYEECLVGDFLADLLVEDEVLVELKAGRGLAKEHEMQLVNYLKATKLEVGLLINFGHSVQVKRKMRVGLEDKTEADSMNLETGTT